MISPQAYGDQQRQRWRAAGVCDASSTLCALGSGAPKGARQRPRSLGEFYNFCTSGRAGDPSTVE
jgi:hypothetical protein